MFPAVSGSRWAINQSSWAPASRPSAERRFPAGLLFLLLRTGGDAGLLLNLLPPRQFTRASGYLQGLLVGLMLVLIVLSFSIQAQVTNLALRPEFARWLPPVWFLGLHQAMLGDPDPAMQALAHRATTAFGVAMALVLLTYMVSYRRHRALLVEGAATERKHRRWTGAIFDRLMPDTRQQAITVFLAKTLAGSSQHRVILMGYGGFGLAILLSGMISMREVVKPDRVLAARFVYAHVILLVFLLIGVRHLFQIPVELKANWAFQITESEGRRRWLDAVDRFVLFSGAAVMLILPFPFECYLLGWRAVGESLLFSALAMLLYEWIFSSWEKLPFTCSHLPGKTPAWIVTLQLMGLLGLIPMVNALLLESLYRPILYGIILAIVVAIWAQVHATRRDDWGYMKLKYEEEPDPAIHGLNLMG